MATYNPSNHIPLSKAMGASKFPVDGKFMYFTNGENGRYEYRPFISLAEVISYFPLGSAFRNGAFEICVNDGGVLSVDGSYITGGVNNIYWWANGILDEDLILKSSGNGTPIKLEFSGSALDDATYPGSIVLPLVLAESQTFSGAIRVNYYTDGTYTSIDRFEILTPNYDTDLELLSGFSEKTDYMKIFVPII